MDPPKMEGRRYIQFGDLLPPVLLNLTPEGTSGKKSLDIQEGMVLDPPKMKGCTLIKLKNLPYEGEETLGKKSLDIQDGEVLDPLKMNVRTLIQFKDLPSGFFDMTAEEEDQRYGCLKTFGKESLKKKSLYTVFHALSI